MDRGSSGGRLQELFRIRPHRCAGCCAEAGPVLGGKLEEERRVLMQKLERASDDVYNARQQCATALSWHTTFMLKTTFCMD